MRCIALTVALCFSDLEFAVKGKTLSPTHSNTMYFLWLFDLILFIWGV